MTSMHPGGAERSLIGLLNAFDYDKYQVDLFLNRHEGELLEQIPKEVNLLPAECHYESLAEPLINTIKKGHFAIAAARLLAKFISYIKSHGKDNDAGITGDYSHRFTKGLMPKIQTNVEYDLAISFITPHYFVAEKVIAKTKAAWIHTDYTNISLDKESQMQMWLPYDHLVAVSDEVARKFSDVFPSLSNKVEVIENILPIDSMRLQAKEPIYDFGNKDEFRILSIGRFTYAKNFENIPVICKYLCEYVTSFKWYIVGYGGGESLIRRAIEEEKMENRVIILGKRKNPYPYIAQCNLYVQPSRFEGKAVAVREAQVFCKPVVITNFPTAQSQLIDGVNGIIVPLDPKECAKKIAQLLLDSKTMAQLQYNCKLTDFSNLAEIEKVYLMIES